MLEHYYEVLGISYNHVLYVNNCLTLLCRLIDNYAPQTPNVVPPKTNTTSRFNSTISSILTKKQKTRISTSSLPSASSATTMFGEFFIIIIS